MNYDTSKYRALGIGEKTQPGDFGVSPLDGELMPCEGGEWVVTQDDYYTYIRPIGVPVGADLANSLGIKTEIGRRALAIAIANVQLLDTKQQDYGSENIAAFGEYGVLVRTWDKVSRLKNLLRNVQAPKNESLEDSWVDLCNYAIIALLCRRGEWK